ncbi:MAG: hypothetical protein GY760_14125 [Deltaproteobacteria bacterium]|nr:hypothetical protein [Deltaproteobacteria bacterium]
MPDYNKIEEMVEDVIVKEGGFVNHKADRGGATNFGITHKTLSEWFRRPVSIQEVKELDIELAKIIYRRNYYFRPGINELPNEIQPLVFDSAINHGPKTAIKLLQIVLKRLGFPIEADGIIGPITIKGANQAQEKMDNSFINSIVDERINYYEAIVKMNSTQEVFLKGWKNRAESFRKEV